MPMYPSATAIRLAPLALLLGLSGCTLGPDYARPGIDSPSAWRKLPPPVVTNTAAVVDATNTLWWTQFGDPALDALVAEALAGNLDIRIAAARVDQFLGALGATRSQLFPQLGYGVNLSTVQASRLGVPPLPPGADPTFGLFEGALSASWQMDLFGRIRRQSEAAQAQVYASEQGQRGVVLTLVSNIATSYIALRALDRQLEIAKATAANFEKTAHIFDLRFKQGIISKTEVMQINSQVQQARTAIPAFEQAIAAQENLISILLGRNPGPIPRGKTIDELLVPQIPANLPSTLLERRPDVLQAEQNLVAANANVGAARALYYPNISLTGLLGTISTDFSRILSSDSTAYSLGASITGPIFTFGAIKGQNNAADAVREQALLGYRLTVLNAFRETNDALIGSAKKAEEVAAQQLRVDALREFARLAALRFDNGLTGYLEVIFAENELFVAELNATRLRTERQAQVINVYRAMGGGWVDLAAAKARQPIVASAEPSSK
jgi:multidrug efflux system outer membrane protein